MNADNKRALWWWGVAIAVFLWWNLSGNGVTAGSGSDTNGRDVIRNTDTGIGWDPVDPNAWNGYDLDCVDVGGPVSITGSDPNRLDADGDGIGCE